VFANIVESSCFGIGLAALGILTGLE